MDVAGLKEKYAQERDKRLRPDGPDQYQRLPHASADPYEPLVPREPKTDHVTVCVIGAGFAGLVTGARLTEAGVTGVRLVEKAGDVGGTWYWNRYPGAQCDTSSLVYMPLLEETGHRPSEKYARGPEILEHSRRIARHYGLYDNALFHTQVSALDWDEDRAVWRVRTNRGDDFTAQFVTMGLGILHVPKLPGIPGVESFGGEQWHTSRWDYEATGGDAGGGRMTALADKRVAIVGTGATAVQVVPHLARSAKEVLVVQRTPSSIDVRNNAPIDPEWFESIATPGWQQRWLENFTQNQAGGGGVEDLVMDGWTDLARRIRSRIAELPVEGRTLDGMLAAYEQADFQKMEEIRARVDDVVADPATAEGLKPWYRQLCKRPCFHDEYLQAFNTPGVRLVDTDGRGVARVTKSGIVVGDEEIEVDAIVWASGFETSGDLVDRTGYEVTGRDGLTLSQAWEDGLRTLHGTHVHGFPNLFLTQPVQAANLVSNVPHNLLEAARTVARVVAHALETGARTVEATQEAQDAWVALLLTGPGMLWGGAECTPGYYNNEGRTDDPRAKYFVGYPYGAVAYFSFLDGWRSDGRFDGLRFGAAGPVLA